MPEYTLYYLPSACSLSPHISLIEAGADYKIVKAEKTPAGLEIPGGAAGEFLKVNPKGSVPALVHKDGHVYTEGIVINQYLADKYKDLYFPLDGDDKWNTLEWANFLSSDLHKGLGIFFSGMVGDDLREMLINKLNRGFAVADAQLAKTKFLLGDKFSPLDAYLYTLIRWTVFTKIDTSKYTNLHRFLTEVEQRPSVQQALKEESVPPLFSGKQ